MSSAGVQQGSGQSAARTDSPCMAVDAPGAAGSEFPPRAVHGG